MSVLFKATSQPECLEESHTCVHVHISVYMHPHTHAHTHALIASWLFHRQRSLQAASQGIASDKSIPLSLTAGPQLHVDLRGDEIQSLGQLEVVPSYPIHDQNLSHALPRVQDVVMILLCYHK